ncbi:MAG: GNAT family N-acetyltransferase [Gemmatimonadetes bacterium]|nr:GNAT family N-acetyltransferase [Gemmatimonadota bacterium]MBI3504509.1 GNAT family N-acetyltransferase [Pseudomonadota bacterium]
MSGRARAAEARDHEAVLALNNGATPHVNALSAEAFAWLADHAEWFRVWEDEGGIAAFALVLRSGLDYWSENYKWFSARHGSFLYLDRIVVAERARGRGVGRALYDDLVAFAEGRWPRITLEVNLRPPNPGSVAFHERIGFRRVGVREEDGGEKAVLMMERELLSSPSSGRPDPA